jgi:hypothetical protein
MLQEREALTAAWQARLESNKQHAALQQAAIQSELENKVCWVKARCLI